MDEIEIDSFEIITPELEKKIIDLIDLHIYHQKEGLENNFRPMRRQVTCNKIDYAREIIRSTGRNIVWIESNYISNIAVYYVEMNHRAFVINIGFDGNEFYYVDEYWCNNYPSCVET